MARRFDLDSAREAAILEAQADLRDATEETESAKKHLKDAKAHLENVLDKCGLEKVIVVGDKIILAVMKRSAEDGPLFRGGEEDDDQAPMGLVRHGPYTAER